MDIYEQITNYLLSSQDFNRWPEMQTVFHKAVSGKPKHWIIPHLSCEAVGGAEEQAIPAVAAVACMQISIMLIDDMLDADPRGEYNRLGLPATANLAAALQAFGLEAIQRSNLADNIKLTAIDSINAMMRKTALGQYLDTLNSFDEFSYWKIIQTKSSPFFGASMHIGGLFGGCSFEIGQQLKQLGDIYGECIQIHDDLHDSLEVPANPDWARNRPTLPILFAQVVNHPEQEKFLGLYREVDDPKKLTEAQEILIRCGAVSYCFDRIFDRYKEATSLLEKLSLQNKYVLEQLFAELVSPIRVLMEEISHSQKILL